MRSLRLSSTHAAEYTARFPPFECPVSIKDPFRLSSASLRYLQASFCAGILLRYDILKSSFQDTTLSSVPLKVIKSATKGTLTMHAQNCTSLRTSSSSL